MTPVERDRLGLTACTAKWQQFVGPTLADSFGVPARNGAQ